MTASLMDISGQCCDADAYLDLGYMCAQANRCYNELRPMGDALWFSIPYRLGTSLDILVYLQFFLLALVAGTAWFTLQTLLRSDHREYSTKITLVAAAAWLLFLAILWNLIRPTFFHTLSDTPATLLFVEGMLLLIPAWVRNSGRLYFATGSFLGLAIVMRSAYLNPVVMSLLVYLLLWIVKKQYLTPRWKSIWILSLSLPIAVQCYANWKNEHEFGFTSSLRATELLKSHLLGKQSGYDTALPQVGMDWFVDKEPELNMPLMLVNGDFAGFARLMGSRIFFFLGSWYPDTYLFVGRRVYLDNWLAESFNEKPWPFHLLDVPAWHLHQIGHETNSALSPAGDLTADKFFVAEGPHDDSAGHYLESASMIPMPPGSYRYSIWLWRPRGSPPQSLDIQLDSVTLPGNSNWTYEPLPPQRIQDPLNDKALTYINKLRFSWLKAFASQMAATISRHDMRDSRVSLATQPIPWLHTTLSRQRVALTETATQYSFDVPIAETSYVAVRFSTASTGGFLAWGATLEDAHGATGYQRYPVKITGAIAHHNDNAADQRTFSWLLLAANLAAIILAMIYLFLVARRFATAIPVFIAGCLMLIVVQTCLFIPEQRFVQGLLATSWFFTLSAIAWLVLTARDSARVSP